MENTIVVENTNSTAGQAKAPHRMSTRQRVIFFLTAWLIVLMPFLFWWNTWFGRQLSDKRIAEYLRDDKHPRHIQHALVQVGEHMSRQDKAVVQWYPELVRLASHPVEEVRNTDAWVMGQDNSVSTFHQALVQMLSDSSLTVRGNAALSLVRFGDATGRPQIVALLQPAHVAAPRAGQVTDTAKAGAAVYQGGLIAKLRSGEQVTEVRSPIKGRVRSLAVTRGAQVSAGADLATIDPESEQVWEALRALYLIGQPEDLPAIRPYTRELPEIPDRVRQQAQEAERAIKERGGK